MLAPHMARAGAALLRQAELLVPVPLHRLRLFQRRYNQAAVLARCVSRIAGVPTLLDALIRVKGIPEHLAKSVGPDQRAVTQAVHD